MNEQQECCDTSRGVVGGTCDYCGGVVQPEPVVTPLPCPFCGSAAVIEYDDQDRKMLIKPFYKCSDDEKCRVFGTDGATEAQALERWNYRPQTRN